MAYANFSDLDGDNVPWLWDKCPDIYNPDQSDSDGDGPGDLCDACTDSDYDGYGEPGFPANTCRSTIVPVWQTPLRATWMMTGSAMFATTAGLSTTRTSSTATPTAHRCRMRPIQMRRHVQGLLYREGGRRERRGDYPDEVSLGDIMLLVDVKFVSGDCSTLACVSEADVNQDGGEFPTCEDHVTLGDIMTLVDFLFITGPENATLPACL